MSDRAQAIVPVAARLAAAVDREDGDTIAHLLTALTTDELYALAVVLAAHVDVPLLDQRRPHNEVDEVIVMRLLAYDASLAGIATRAEREEVTRRWAACGRGMNDLADMTGWKPERYRKAICGTDSGYYRHRRTLREPACEACRRAHTEAQRIRGAA